MGDRRAFLRFDLVLTTCLGIFAFYGRFEIAIRRRGMFRRGSTVGTKWFRRGTIQVMTLRPRIEEETVEELDEKLQAVMTVDPATVGLDKKIEIVMDEWQKERQDRLMAQNQTNQDQGGYR